MYKTTNYLFAAYLQTKEGGSSKIKKVEKKKPGRATFFFDIDDEVAQGLKVAFHDSVCYEFEETRKKTISLAYD